MAKLAINGAEPVRTDSFHKWPIFGEDDELMLLDALRSGYWGLRGKFVPALQALYSQLHGAKHALCVSNGTIGLITAMRAAGIGKGDEVIIPSYTFIATASAVIEVGAVPVCVDVDPATCCIDPEAIERAINEQTRAIMPVHVAGQPADMDSIIQIADRHRLVVIEDSAQAHGAEWNGRRVGAIGLAGTFSFQSSKNLTSGEGGMIVTNDDSMAYSCYAYLNSGRAHKDDPAPKPVMGQNYRMTEFQAALLISQLSKFAEQFSRRQENAAYLSTLLNNIEGVEPPGVHPKVTGHAWHLYMVRFSGEKFRKVDLAKISEAMVAEGIPMRKGYMPLYSSPVFAEGIVHCVAAPCPVCEQICASTLWISQNTLLGCKKDMEDIAEGLEKVAVNLDELI